LRRITRSLQEDSPTSQVFISPKSIAPRRKERRGREDLGVKLSGRCTSMLAKSQLNVPFSLPLLTRSGSFGLPAVRPTLRRQGTERARQFQKCSGEQVSELFRGKGEGGCLSPRSSVLIRPMGPRGGVVTQRSAKQCDNRERSKAPHKPCEMPTPATDPEQITIKFHGFSTSRLARFAAVLRDSSILKSQNPNKSSIYRP
jgi:hypothetical protein